MPKKICRKNPTIAPVPHVPRTLAKVPQRQEPTAPPGQDRDGSPGAIQRATYADLIRDCREAAPEGEGMLVTVIAPPRYGKTRVIREFIEDERKRGSLILAHDPKDPPQFEGVPIPEATPEAVLGTPTNGTNQIRRFGVEIRPDDVAALGLDFARGGNYYTQAEGIEIPKVRTCLVIDEASHAIHKAQSFDGENLPRCYTEGSSQGLTTLVGTQYPQRFPTIGYDFSQCLVIGMQARRGLPYLARSLMLPDELVDLLPYLEPGHFAMLRQARDWNRKIYYTYRP